jgi:hypothetical protein
VEVSTGEGSLSMRATKMANSIDTSAELQRIYLPVNVAAVRAADAAWKLGQQRIHENNRSRIRKAPARRVETKNARGAK